MQPSSPTTQARPPAVSRALGLLERQGSPPGRAPGIDVNVLRLWIRVSADPMAAETSSSRTCARSPARTGPKPISARRSPPRRGPVALRAGPASPRLRRMAAAAPPDQRRQAHPDGGPGHLPAARCPVMGAAGGGRAESVRGGCHRRPPRTRCARGADPPAAPDRPARQRRPDQPRDRRPALPLTPHGQLAPVPVLPQARGSRPPPAARRDRPRRHTSASTRKRRKRNEIQVSSPGNRT